MCDSGFIRIQKWLSCIVQRISDCFLSLDHRKMQKTIVNLGKFMLATALEFIVALNNSKRHDAKKYSKTVVFLVGLRAYWPFIKPLVDRMNRESNIRVLICASRHQDNPFLMLTHSSSYKNQVIPHILSCKYHFDLLVTASGKPFLAHTPTVHIGHGFPNLGTLSGFDVLSRNDFFFMCGPYLANDLKHWVYRDQPELRRGAIPLKIGLPKIDNLFHNYYDRETVIEELGLSREKTILYAPTYHPLFSSFFRWGPDIIRALSEFKVNVLVKLHYFMFDQGNPNIGWLNSALKDISEIDNVVVLDKAESINPFLSITDILLTDWSGVAWEFLTAFRRPLIFAASNRRKLPIGKTVPEEIKQNAMEYRGRSVGRQVSTSDALKEAVTMYLADPMMDQEKREAFAQEILYNAGQGTETATEAIKCILFGRQFPNHMKLS